MQVFSVVNSDICSSFSLSISGIRKKDAFWTSPISFVSSANCALLCGSKVDFVDIDLKTFNISIEMLEKNFLILKKIRFTKNNYARPFIWKSM